MEWYVFLSLFVAGLLLVLTLRIPVAFGMFALSIIACLLIFGSIETTSTLIGLSVLSSVNSFTFSAIPLFILAGEILFRSRIAQDALTEMGQLLRRVPGRLPMLAVAGGGAFGLLSGSTLANTALFGRTLLPEMREAGYNTRLATGSILASGGLAMILPPSALAILWGGVAQVPIGPLLMAGLIPGILMAIGYCLIVLVWSRRTSAADEDIPPARTVQAAAVGILKSLTVPGLLAVLMLGLIFTGLATPTEAAALGAVGSIIFALILGRLTRQELWNALIGAVRTTATIFFLVMASTLYSQLMAYQGATSGLVSWATESVSNEVVMLILIMLLLIALGAFIDQASIMLITAPLLMPIANGFGWDPLWFSILVLINLQIGNTSPPFGMALFVMRGVAPWVSLPTIYRAVIPWIISDIVVIIILAVFPPLVTFIPSLM